MFGNLRVGTRLTIAFAGVLGLMLIVVAVAYGALYSADRQATRLARDDLALLKAAGAMQVSQLEQAIAIREIVSNEDAAAQKAMRVGLIKSRKAYTNAALVLEQRAGAVGNQRISQIAQKLKAAQGPVDLSIDNAIDLADNAQYAEAATQVYKSVRPLQAEIESQLQQLVGIAAEQVQREAEAVHEEAGRASLQMLAVFAAALMLGIFAAAWLTRSITQPLAAAVSATESVAAGDLTVHVAPGSRDETGRLLAAIAGMRDSLHAVATRIRQGADSVSTASAEISSGNKDLSRRTEEQASSLEETVASIEELTSTVKQNADNAQRASEMAARASEGATNSGRMVDRMVDTMSGIQTSSKRIAEIVGVIDGIAFQTNILALNAAVEAARAGEQGRGFAVVASEVRSLAQRSAGAAKEIKGLIGDGVEKVGAGTKLADEVGRAVGEVVAAANDAARLVAEISAATQEQRTGIEQIGRTMAQMDDLTQRNAGLVEETNAATEALHEQARDLVEAIGRFKLTELPSPSNNHVPPTRENASVSAQRENRKKLPSPALPPRAAAGDKRDWQEF